MRLKCPRQGLPVQVSCSSELQPFKCAHDAAGIPPTVACNGRGSTDAPLSMRQRFPHTLPATDAVLPGSRWMHRLQCGRNSPNRCLQRRWSFSTGFDAAGFPLTVVCNKRCLCTRWLSGCAGFDAVARADNASSKDTSFKTAPQHLPHIIRPMMSARGHTSWPCC